MDDKKIDLAGLRENYSLHELVEPQVFDLPLLQFDKWMKEAIHAKLPEPNAMTLSTISEDGFPQSRVVLLKDVSEGKLIFYTNYQSKKGMEITSNPKVSLNFLWKELERQVRIVGTAKKVGEKISDTYFASRPRGSQIGAWVSPQSRSLASRKELDNALAVYNKKFENVSNIPRPSHWGGFEVDPLTVEFWQGRTSRLHDRILYSLVGGNWQTERLAP